MMARKKMKLAVHPSPQANEYYSVWIFSGRATYSVALVHTDGHHFRLVHHVLWNGEWDIRSQDSAQRYADLLNAGYGINVDKMFDQLKPKPPSLEAYLSLVGDE